VWLGESGGKRRRGWLAAGLSLTLLAATTTLFLYTYASTVAVATYVAQAQVGYLTQVWWEVAPAGGCGGPPPQPALSETYPTPKQSGSYPLGAAPKCVWGPRYASAETYSSGPCLLIIYIKAKAAATVTYTLEIADNRGAAVATVAAGTINVAPSNKPQEYTSTAATCAGFTAPAGDYLILSLKDPPGGPGANTVTVYFGPTTPTDVQVTQSADTA